MNQGMFSDMMAAFEGLNQRLDRLIALMEAQQPQVARDEAEDKRVFDKFGLPLDKPKVKPAKVNKAK